MITITIGTADMIATTETGTGVPIVTGDTATDITVATTGVMTAIVTGVLADAMSGKEIITTINVVPAGRGITSPCIG